MMLNYLNRMLCRHEWVWSERRRKEICYRCRLSRSPTNSGQMLGPAASTVSTSCPFPDAADQSDLPVRNFGRDEAEVEPVQRNESLAAALTFGSLNSQSLNAAMVRDVRRT